MFPFKSEPDNSLMYMEVAATFVDFTPQDKSNNLIKPHIYNDEMKIRRIWTVSNLRDNDVPFEVFVPKRFLKEINGDGALNSTMYNNVSEELKEQYEIYLSDNDISPGGTIPKKNRGDFIIQVFLNNPSLIQEEEPEWKKNPNGYSSLIRSVIPKVIFVPAVKLIDEEADANKNKSAANQITAALFELHLNQTPEIQDFKNSLVSLKNIFNADTGHGEVRRLEEKLSKKLKRLMDVEANVDFEIPEVMEKLHLNSNIYLKHNDLVTIPSQQGNGVQRMLILSLLELMAEQLTQNDLDVNDESQEWKRSFYL